jgi:hypothetical protein
MEDPLLYDMWQERGGLSDIVSSWGLPSSPADKNPPSNGYSQQDHHEQQQQQQQTQQQRKSEMLRQVVKMAKLPRLVHMPTTAETVNAVEALITAGEVDMTQCCAILEKQEGVAALEYIIQQKSDMVRGERHQEWIQEGRDNTNENQPNEQPQQPQTSRWTESRRLRAGGGAGLQMICTSTIYDDLFRQVRIWARMGFTSAQIQKEMDLRFHEILEYSHEAQKDALWEETLDHNHHATTSFDKTDIHDDLDIPSQETTISKTT